MPPPAQPFGARREDDSEFLDTPPHISLGKTVALDYCMQYAILGGRDVHHRVATD
jgi:hypothetical protein